MKEITKMNTNTMELNMNEMATVNGGDGVRIGNPNSTFSKNSTNWFNNTVVPAAENFGKAVCTVSKAAYNWVTGLFD